MYTHDLHDLLYLHGSIIYKTQQMIEMPCLPLPISHSDPSLTSHNVHQVMEVVRQKRWREVGIGVLAPDSILDKIDAKCSSDDEKMSAMIKYVVTIIPDATWETIAAALYEKDEEKAVERVKPYLHIFPGESCQTSQYSTQSEHILHIIVQPHLHHLIIITQIKQLARFTLTIKVLEQYSRHVH